MYTNEDNFTSSIPARTLAIVPTIFTSPPKMNCYYDLSGTQSITGQDLFVVPLLKIISKKLPTQLLCTIINMGPDHIKIPKNRHIDNLTPLNHTYTTTKTAFMNEITHIVKPNTIKFDWLLHNDEMCTPNKHHKDQFPLVCTLIQPSELDVHCQVHSTLPITKNMWRFCFIIGSFSLRVM